MPIWYLEVTLLQILRFLWRHNFWYIRLYWRKSVQNFGILNLSLETYYTKLINVFKNKWNISVIIYCPMINGNKYSHSSTPNKPWHTACWLYCLQLEATRYSNLPELDFSRCCPGIRIGLPFGFWRLILKMADTLIPVMEKPCSMCNDKRGMGAPPKPKKQVNIFT